MAKEGRKSGEKVYEFQVEKVEKKWRSPKNSLNVAPRAVSQQVEKVEKWRRVDRENSFGMSHTKSG